MSEAGERNKGDLLYAMAKAAYERDVGGGFYSYSDAPDWAVDVDRKDMAAILGLLIHKGYLTEAGIIAAKAIDDGA